MLVRRLIATFSMAVLATSIQAETVNCTPITSLPATITAQGLYCLTGNLSTSQTTGNAITINASNVTLDLNGWKLGGQGAGTATTAFGIYSVGNNVTIKNGIVRGFENGVALWGSGGVVKDLLVDESTVIGIFVNSPGAQIIHNRITNTGGSTVNALGSVTGISADNSNITVSDNVIIGLSATGSGEAIGIIAGLPYSVVRNNVISNAAIPPDPTTSYGIYEVQSIVLNNTVSNFTYGIYNVIDGIYAHNTVNNCTTNYYGGTAGFGNSP